MPLPVSPDDEYGAIIHMEYAYAGEGVVHNLHLPVAHIDQTPSGVSNDYLYDGSGPVVPTETGIVQTFVAFSALWASYYPGLWSLSLQSVWYNVGGREVRLPVVPSAPTVRGLYVGTIRRDPLVRRSFSLYSALGKRWRMWLLQLIDDQVGLTVQVTPDGGGIDARDRLLMAYLSGSATGLVGRDGERFQTGGTVTAWWDRALPSVGPYVVSG